MTKTILCAMASMGLLFLLTSCGYEREVKGNYYPMDSLIHAQVKYLTTSNAALTKIATVDGTSDTTSYTPPGKEAWEKELEIFSSLAFINKPVNKGLYEVADGLQDVNSNLTILAFTTKERVPIPYLKVYYQNVLGKVRKIEAMHAEENPLFKSTRSLLLEFQDVNGTSMLTKYEVRDIQKMIFKDSVDIHLYGTITFH